MSAPDAPAVGSAPRRAAAEWRRQRERGSAFLLRAMACFSLRVGRRPSRAFLRLIVLYFFLFAPRARHHSRRYLQRTLGRAPRAAERYRHLLYFASCIHDRVYLLTEQFTRFAISVEGEEAVRTQLASGRGAILLGAHVGSFEVMRSLGRRQALEVSMAMYQDNARKMSSLVAMLAPDRPPDIIPLGDLGSMLQVAERLERGAWVGMLADRTLGEEPVVEVDFLGARARLPTGPLRAAALLRAPVLFMLGLHRGGNRYHLVFEPLVDFSAPPAAGNREHLIGEAVRRYAARLEFHARRDPFNWFNFYDFWQEDPRA